VSGPSPMAPRIAPDPVKWGKRFTRPELAAAIATFGPVALTGWHAGDTRRGPCARVVLVGGRTRTVPQDAVVLP